MSQNVTKQELGHLRNKIDISAVIKHLKIPSKIREGYVRFLCPLCSEFDTATNPRTNLARCFRCKQNFNPIDLFMADQKMTFLESITYLREIEQRLIAQHCPQKAQNNKHR